MRIIERITQSRAALNAGASYLAFGSVSICGLISIPVAVSYLSKEEMGLWSVMFTVVTYLLWLDLGIGNATGRKIAAAITERNEQEINRWWTLSIGILLLLGLLMFCVALATSPFLMAGLNIPSELRKDALWLFLGIAGLGAIGMPFRAYPGLLTAQERFHWVPITQAIMPWLQLAPFWILLHNGFGIRSYLPAAAISQVAGWTIFVWQVHGKRTKFRVDRKGWQSSRFKELFSFSSSLAIGGIVDSIIQSLPSLILTRMGGLPFVAVYNLSVRAPGLVNSLSQRTTHAFFPNLQNLFVTGNSFRFQEKFRNVSALGVWTGLVAAGLVLGGNRTLISWLAPADFYAGNWTNLWLACSVISLPFVGNMLELFQHSGRMGRTALFSLAELAIAIMVFSLGYRIAGLPGIAATFALLPLIIRGAYSLYAAPAFCGLPRSKLCGRAVLGLACSLGLTIAAGSWIAIDPAPTKHMLLAGHAIDLPNWKEIIAGTILIGIGMSQAVRNLISIRRC